MFFVICAIIGTFSDNFKITAILKDSKVFWAEPNVPDELSEVQVSVRYPYKTHTSLLTQLCGTFRDLHDSPVPRRAPLPMPWQFNFDRNPPTAAIARHKIQYSEPSLAPRRRQSCVDTLSWTRHAANPVTGASLPRRRQKAAAPLADVTASGP